MYDRKLKEYKEKQEDLLLRMEEHNRADEDFYITASTVLDLSSRALEIFKSSEVNEKRALLNFLLQNCVLNGRKLLFELKTPFDVIAQHTKTQDWLRIVDLICQIYPTPQLTISLVLFFNNTFVCLSNNSR